MWDPDPVSDEDFYYDAGFFRARVLIKLGEF